MNFIQWYRLAIAMVLFASLWTGQASALSSTDESLEAVRSSARALKAALKQLKQAHGDLPRTMLTVEQAVLPAALGLEKALVKVIQALQHRIADQRRLIDVLQRGRHRGSSRLQSSRRVRIIKQRAMLLRMHRMTKRIERLRVACAKLPLALEEAAWACGLALDVEQVPADARWTERLGALAKQIELASTAH